MELEVVSLTFLPVLGSFPNIILPCYMMWPCSVDIPNMEHRDLLCSLRKEWRSS